MTRFHLSDRARKFLREIGSIVLGVLIALGIGEVADDLRHHSNATEAMKAVRAGMSGTGISLEERLIKGRCIIRKLDLLRNELASARSNGNLRKLGEIGRPNNRPLSNIAWNTLSSSSELLFVPEESRKIAQEYFAAMNNYLDAQRNEQVAWAKLRVLENRAGAVSENLMADMETTIEEARNYGMLINIIARQMWILQQDLAVRTNHEYYGSDGSESVKALVATAKASPICRPL